MPTSCWTVYWLHGKRFTGTYRDAVKVRQIKIVKVRSWGKTCTECSGCPAKGQLSKLEAKGPPYRQKVRSEGVSQRARSLGLVQ